MTTLSTRIAPTGWQEPEGVAARGTVIVLPGRGETAATYGRLGRRLASDAYRVRVLTPVGESGAATDVSAAPPSDLPILLLHGGADPISSVESVGSTLAGTTRLRVGVVEGARHDVLNDVSHRSVAATLVLFLESLRLDRTLPVVVHDPVTR